MAYRLLAQTYTNQSRLVITNNTYHHNDNNNDNNNNNNNNNNNDNNNKNDNNDNNNDDDDDAAAADDDDAAAADDDNDMFISYSWYNNEILQIQMENMQKITKHMHHIRVVHRVTRVGIQLSFKRYAYLISQFSNI